MLLSDGLIFVLILDVEELEEAERKGDIEGIKDDVAPANDSAHDPEVVRIKALLDYRAQEGVLHRQVDSVFQDNVILLLEDVLEGRRLHLTGHPNSPAPRQPHIHVQSVLQQDPLGVVNWWRGGDFANDATKGYEHQKRDQKEGKGKKRERKKGEEERGTRKRKQRVTERKREIIPAIWEDVEHDIAGGGDAAVDKVEVVVLVLHQLVNHHREAGVPILNPVPGGEDRVGDLGHRGVRLSPEFQKKGVRKKRQRDEGSR